MAPSESQSEAGGPSEVRFEPDPSKWNALVAGRERHAGQEYLGRTADEWRTLTRRELGIPADRPVIATGHEAVLWHPGILAKYIALKAWSDHCGAACVHLVVDQHVGGFDAIDVPVRSESGALAVATVSLGALQPDVPMGWHPPFDPPALKANLHPALPSVRDGLNQILDLVRAHRNAPHAAAQMSAVLDELLRPWFTSIPGVTATALMTTSLARAMVSEMARDPRRAVQHYNLAVAQLPEAGIGGLAVSANEIELPLWRIDADGVRKRALDRDAREWLENPDAFALLPRALTMTALLRLGACDVFIHGFGGARYDPAMEAWMRAWLGAATQPIAMVSATLRLPFGEQHETPLDAGRALHALRHRWHDPAGELHWPSETKRRFLAGIDAAPRNSVERRQAYLEMHDVLAGLRREHRASMADAEQRLERARRQQRERDIVDRRTWPFPFYPQALISELARTIACHVRSACSESSPAVTAARSTAP